jgi:hypothetical protein
LQSALTSRVVIEQAKGVLTELRVRQINDDVPSAGRGRSHSAGGAC